MFTFKIDENVELKLLQEHHAEELFALSDKNREYLRQWLPWLDRTQSASDSKGFIKFTLDQFAKNEGMTAGIWFHQKLVGVISFNQINWANRKAIIGYWCDSEHQGLGLVTKACRAFIQYAFKELKLNRIESACATGNAKSQAIPKRLGFAQEGISREGEWLYDHFVDHVNFAMLAKDWTS